MNEMIYEFSIVINGEVFKKGDIVEVVPVYSSNDYSYLDDTDHSFTEICVGRIECLDTESITIDCSEKFQSKILKFKLNSIFTLKKYEKKMEDNSNKSLYT